MTMQIQTLRRDNGQDYFAESQRLRMSNELAGAKRDPTVEEIEAMCAEIRESWSEREHWVRRGYPGGRPVYTVPRVSNFIKKDDVASNPVGLDGLPLSEFLILIGQ